MDHFNGKLLVLIDGGTFSSGALLAAAIKAQRKGVVFIGRETAGSEEGCNGVTLQKLTLPHSKIVIDFPLMRVVSVAKSSLKGRGIQPDYIVTYSPEDVVTQNDPDIKKALQLINQ
jgi:C-terminal processing protease CtpA/Prc